MLEAGGSVLMPEPPDAQYLVDLLFRCSGPVGREGALDERDIEARVRLLGLDLDAWEAEALLKMSQGYAAEMYAAEKPEAPSPWPEVTPLWRWARNQAMQRKMDDEERKAEKLKQHREKKRNGGS